MGVLSALLWAAGTVMARRGHPNDPPLTAMACSAVLGLVLAAPAIGTSWIRPSLFDAGVMLLMGLLNGASHFCFVYAFHNAPAPTLAPFGYLRLILAILIGVVGWHEVPDGLAVVGSVLILASGGVAWAAGCPMIQDSRRQPQPP